MNEFICLLALSAGPSIGMILAVFWKKAGMILGAVWTAVFIAVFAAVYTGPHLPFAAVSAWGILGVVYGFYILPDSGNKTSGFNSEINRLHSMKKELEGGISAVKAELASLQNEQKKSRAVYTAIKSLSETFDISTVKPRIEGCIKDYLETDEFALYLQDLHNSGSLEKAAGQSRNNSALENWSGLLKAAEKAGHDFSAPFILEGPAVLAVSPILDANGLIGCLSAVVPGSGAGLSAKQEFLARLRRFGDEIAFALKRLKLFQQVEWLSQIDGLTGVFRRSVLDERLKDETLRAKAFMSTYCLMILDIDHFKKLNDDYGHQFGDAVLRRMGEILKSSVYETDFVARYGGEEFSVLLPRADSAGVLRKAEMIRSRIEREKFAQGLETVGVTVSIGIAHFPRDGQAVEEIVKKADTAMYCAKQKGRNRIIDASQI